MTDDSKALDQTIKAWLEQQREKALKEAETENRVMSSRSITISREFGCEGFPLAVAIKELLDDISGDTWTIFDSNLIEKLEAEYDLTKEFLEHLGDKAAAVDRLKAMLSRQWSKGNEDKYKRIADTLFSVASAGHAIIVGRGGSVITAELPNCFHFRLIAPLEYRINSFKTRTVCTLEEATQAIAESDQNRRQFFMDFLGADLSDPQHYHAVFNTKRAKISSIARSIVNLVGF